MPAASLRITPNAPAKDAPVEKRGAEVIAVNFKSFSASRTTKTTVPCCVTTGNQIPCRVNTLVSPRMDISKKPPKIENGHFPRRFSHEGDRFVSTGLLEAVFFLFICWSAVFL